MSTCHPPSSGVPLPVTFEALFFLPCAMGLRQSKEEALYLRASRGNVEAVRALHRDGAGLEWVDKEGKTPLIFSCSRPDGMEMARTLLELGANLNAYRPGSHAGTPLHHTVEKGLEQTANLLLSHGANVLRMNDDCQTALDLARAKGHCNIVRNIENRICFFMGWLRELYGPGFLKAFAPKWVSRKIWAVVLPCDQRSSVSPLRLQLAIYPTLQVAQPQTIISLWNVNIEEANFNQPDPVVVIVDKNNKKRFEFLSAHEGDKQQLLCFYNACKVMVQQNIPTPITHESLPMVTPALPNPSALASPANASISAPEDVELAMAINASLQSAVAEGLALVSGVTSEVQSDNASGWANSENTTNNGWGPPDRPLPSAQNIPLTEAAPSAPPLSEDIFTDGAISYPSIDSSPINLPTPAMQGKFSMDELKEDRGVSGTCVVCLDAAVEGACIPCGHMAGCMSCLNDIKAKQWGCPVCRAKIVQVIKLYSV